MSRPSNATRPDVGGTAPEIALNKVVLPAPFGPMMARRSPRLTRSETSSTAFSASKRTPTWSSLRISSDTRTPDHDTIIFSGLLDALEIAGIGRLLHVGHRV